MHVRQDTTYAKRSTTSSSVARLPHPLKLRVTAELCPQVLLRVLGLIAQQGIVPDVVNLKRRSRTMVLHVQVTGVPVQAAEVLLNKISGVIAVRTVAIMRVACKKT